MGQKAHPKVLRLGIVEEWDSCWYSLSDYSHYILSDELIRNYIKKHCAEAKISRIVIKRRSDNISVSVHCARTGVILGKGGEDVAKHREALSKLVDNTVGLSIIEISDPEKNAQLLAENICTQLEKRTPYRRAMKQVVQWAMKAGALGIKVACSGRLGGVEIARSEWYLEGKVPLHTLRANIDYAFSEAQTTYGKIGVKVWVYNGEVLDHKSQKAVDLDQNTEIELEDVV